jgi:hypothetical protein
LPLRRLETPFTNCRVAVDCKDRMRQRDSFSSCAELVSVNVLKVGDLDALTSTR